MNENHSCTCRVGHHSTSDDWTAYRSTEEVSYWNEIDHPIYRLRKYMDSKGMWDDQQEEQFVKALRQKVRHINHNKLFSAICLY